MKRVLVLSAAALAALIGLAASSPNSPKLQRSRIRPSSIRQIPPEPPEPADVRSRVIPPAPPPRVIEGSTQRLETSNDVDRLQAWLLSLPDRDLAKLVGTSELDGYVERVIVGLERRQPDPTGPSVEVDLFLMMLNKRLDAAQL